MFKMFTNCNLHAIASYHAIYFALTFSPIFAIFAM